MKYLITIIIFSLFFGGFVSFIYQFFLHLKVIGLKRGKKMTYLEYTTNRNFFNDENLDWILNSLIDFPMFYIFHNENLYGLEYRSYYFKRKRYSQLGFILFGLCLSLVILFEEFIKI